jgi:prepilin signal peptidase PulO-like enzyme (type II secretory pathway)
MSFAELNPLDPLLLAVVGLVGACMGSFITLITYRLPLDLPVGNTRSRCTICKRDLGVRDLFPIFSWVFSRGKCRQCKTPISMRYPLTELACALGAIGSVYYFGLTLEAFAIAGLWWSIVAIIVTDLEHYIILDEVQIAVGLFGIIHAYANGFDWANVLIAASAGVGIGLALKYGFLYFRNKDGLGMGDVKFLGVAGIWLSDAYNFVPFLFFSGLFGVASGLLWRACGHGERFPFGPALALALFFCITLPQLANGFWQLYGLLP